MISTLGNPRTPSSGNKPDDLGYLHTILKAVKVTVNSLTVISDIEILIQRDVIGSLGRSRERLWKEGAQGNGKQSRMGLAEKVNASGVHGIMVQKT